MNVLIFGATGMLGHKLMHSMSQSFTVYGTLRRNKEEFLHHPIMGKMNLIGNTSADNGKSIEDAIEFADPDVAINCVGIIKQLPEAKDPIKSITINSLFPHVLAQQCGDRGIRLIHLSTDCVFSGKKGDYSETDVPDAFDLYGRSKLLGELDEPGCLTLRTSIIGRELNSANGLLEWFLSQKGQPVKGYKNAIFSGFTTNALSEIITQIIIKYPDLGGLYHVSSNPISKYDLLNLVKEQYNLEINIEPDFHEVSNRSLNSSKFRSTTKIYIPDWKEMVKDMYQDSTPYDTIRSHHAIQ